MVLKNYTIYGERCSGTNYLQNIININFDVKFTNKYGHKHFFGFQDEDLKNSDDTLFICIVRDPVNWMNSFFMNPHHLPIKYKKKMNKKEKMNEFFNKEFFSINDWDHNYCKWDKENMHDRNIYTGKRYKNIFEMRHTKIKWLLEDLPKKVKNYIFITYEELLNNFNNTLIKIKNKGLKIKNNYFPKNTDNYKNNNNKKYIPKKNIIDSKIIINHPNFIKHYEKKLGYIK